MSYFKIAILTVFSVSIVASIAIFATSKGSSNVQGASDVIVWGTIPEEQFNNTFTESSLSSNKDVRATYVRKDPSSFDADFVEALSEGRGPDLVILRDDLIYKNRNKLVSIPYKSFSERKFKDSFIEEAEIFLTEEGIVAVPFIVDPMVMYWNRDLFGSNQIANPPKYWEEIPNIVERITRKDSQGNVLQSTLPFGEWRNVTNAKEIVSMLMFQAGTSITTRSGSNVKSDLNNIYDKSILPSHSAINFYTQFSNPTNPLYTWNRALPSSLNSFLSGNLAMYFGFASELFSIREKNSNLNFDVTYVPQLKESKKKVVFGRMYAFAIPKQSKNVNASYMLISAMVEPKALTALEKSTSLPPVRRDMLSSIPTDSYRSVFYSSALISKSWIDPDPNPTTNAFRDMIESITSGKSRTTEAVSRLNSQLEAELN